MSEPGRTLLNSSVLPPWLSRRQRLWQFERETVRLLFDLLNASDAWLRPPERPQRAAAITEKSIRQLENSASSVLMLG